MNRLQYIWIWIVRVKIENILEIPKIKELKPSSAHTSNSLPANSKIKSTFLFTGDPTLWETNADDIKYVSKNIPNQNINRRCIRSAKEFNREKIFALVKIFFFKEF